MTYKKSRLYHQMAVRTPAAYEVTIAEGYVIICSSDAGVSFNSVLGRSGPVIGDLDVERKRKQERHW